MKKYLKSNGYFLAGMLCMLAANIPSVYAALTVAATAPLGFLILLQLGLGFYLLDAITQKRPVIFGISGLLNSVLNGIVLTIALGNL